MSDDARPGPEALPETMCAMPWLNLSLDVNGSSRPCCRFEQPDPDSRYQLANMRDTDLEGVWNSEAMQLLRQDFLEGRRPRECSTCWDEEAAGIPSWRQTFTRDRAVPTAPDYSTVTPAQPVALDLKLSNSCNLKCRICGPIASSLWLQEELQGDDEHVKTELLEQRSYLRSNKITRQETNTAIFRRWVSQLDHVEMTGGEPMFSAENREVIETIAAHGDPARTSLQITTNATVIDDRILTLLPRFGHVSVTLSIDDIAHRHTYERSPGRWEDVEANMAVYEKLAGPDLTVGINCSVSALNVWYLPEMIRWWMAVSPDRRVRLALSLVHSPDRYDIRNLPEVLKASVAERLAEASADPAVPADLQARLASITEFMRGTPDDPAAWSDLWRHTAHRDRVRGESHQATFPELWQEMARLGLEPDLRDPPTAVESAPPVSESPVRVLARRLLRR